MSADLPDLVKALTQIRKKAFPFAVQRATNEVSLFVQKRWLQNLGRKVTLRNRWTAGSIKYYPSKTLKIGRIRSFAGSKGKYMDAIEEGVTRRAKGKHGLPIQTKASRRAGTWRGLSNKEDTLKSVQLARRTRRGKDRDERNYLQLLAGAKNRTKVAIIETRRNTIILGRVTGDVKAKNLKVKALWVFKDKAKTTEKTDVAQNAMEDGYKRMDVFFSRSIRRELTQIKARNRL